MRISDWSSDVCSSDLLITDDVDSEIAGQHAEEERAHLHDKGLVKAEAKTQGLAQLRRGARSQHYGRRVARDHVYHCEEQGDSHCHDGAGAHPSSNQLEPPGSGVRLPASRLSELVDRTSVA